VVKDPFIIYCLPGRKEFTLYVRDYFTKLLPETTFTEEQVHTPPGNSRK
jgi:hypothetical protein